ncbi:hypothetical protein HDK77DRAFT_265166 [Phyllosticta capitalensis]
MHTSSRADPPKRPERLRDSCNSCAQAKVRCTRDKPVCARCATKSLRCDYSPSMRKGKQRTTGGSISSTKKSSGAGSPRKSPSQPHEDLRRSYSTSSHGRTSSHHQFPRMDQNLRTPSPQIPWNDGIWSCSDATGGSFPGLFSQDVFAMPYMAQPLPDMYPACGPLPNAFGVDQISLDCAGVGAFADLSGYAGGDGAAMGAMDDMDVAMLGNDGMFGLGEQKQQSYNQAVPLSHGSPSAMSTSSSSTGTVRTNDSTQHDCMARVLEMMAQVNSSQVEGGPAVPSQIRILVRNKTIVDSIAQILQCGVCMQEMRTPHILTILTISLIASYKCVLQSFAGDQSTTAASSTSNSSSTASSTSTSPPPPPTTTGSSLPPTMPTTNTIAPALAALSGLGIDAATSTHGAPIATPSANLLHHGAGAAAGFGPLPPAAPQPQPQQPSMMMASLRNDAKTRMQIIFTELARVRTLVDAMADALRECGRSFDERAAAAAAGAAAASEDSGAVGMAGVDGGAGAGGGEAENLTHSMVLGQLEKVLRAKERSVFQAVVRAVR